MEFTEQDLVRMRDYESRTGQRIIYSFEEKLEIYRKSDKNRLERTAGGIQRSLFARMNLDNEDCFDGPDDAWKTKQLQENLEAILRVIAEKN